MGSVERSEAAVWELGRLISGAELDSETFEVLAEQIRPLLPFDRMSLSVLEAPGRFRAFHSHGVGVDGRDDGAAITGGGKLADFIVESGETLVVGDAEALQDEYPALAPAAQKAGLHSLVGTPLVTDAGNTLGVLYFWSFRRNQYGPVDRRIAEAVASQLVNPVEAASLRDTLESEQRNRRSLTRIGEILAGSTSLEEAFGGVAGQIKRILPVDRVVITVVDQATGRPIDRLIWGEGVAGRDDRPAAEMTSGPTSVAVIASGKSVSLSRAEMSAASAEADPGLAASYEAGFRASMYAVLRYNRRIIGTLNVKSKSVDQFEGWHLATLDQIAAQLSGVVAAFEVELTAGQARDEHRAIRDVTRIIGSSMSIHDVFDRFAEELTALIPADRVVISIIDEDRDEVEDAYISGEQMPGWGAGETHPLTGSLTEEIMKTRRVVILDAEMSRIQAERYPAQAAGLGAGLRSMVVAPLIFEGQVVGTLNLRSRADHAYDEQHAAIIELIGPQIAGAIANERLTNQLRRKAQAEAQLAGLGELLISEPGTEDLFQRLTAYAESLLGADMAFLREVDWHSRTLANLVVSGGEEGVREPFEGTIAESVITTGAPFIVNPGTMPEVVARHPSITPLAGQGVKSGVIVPLTYEGRRIGVLGAWRKSNLRFAREDVELAGRVADLVSAAVAAQRLNDRVRRQLQIESRLAEMGSLLISGETGGAVFQRITANVRALLEADAVVLREVNVRAGIVINLDVAGRPGAGPASDEREDLEGSVTDMVTSSRRTHVFYPEPAEDPDDDDDDALTSLGGNGMRAGIIVPLLFEDQGVGILAAWRRSERRFTEEEVELAERVANLVTGELVQERMNGELRRRAEAESILADIGGLLNSTDEGGDVFERLTENVKALMRADIVALREVDADAGIITTLDVSGQNVSALTRGEQEPLRGTLVEQTVRGGLARAFDYEELKAAVRQHPPLGTMLDAGVKSGMVIPLTFREMGVGVLAIWRMADSSITDEEIALAARVADLVSGAVVQHRLRESLRREAQIQSALNEIARTMSSDLSLGNVFNRFAGQVAGLVKVDRLVVAMLGEDGRQMIDKYIYGTRISEWDRRPVHATASKPTLEAMTTGRPVVLSIDQSERTPPESGGVAGASVGLKSAVFVPLISDGVPIGTLNVKSFEESAYSEADVNLLVRIADQIAGPVAASELHLKSIALSRERELRLEAEAERRQLQRADQERSKFLSTVSHELRTPLAAMVAFADLLAANRRQNLTPRQVEMADTIRRNGDRLAQLVDDLLDISRLQAGNLELQRSMIDPARLLRDLLTDLKPLLDNKGQSLQTWIRAGLEPVWADEARLTQVLSNLISNASKYSPPGSAIKIRADRRDGILRLSVADEGIGISKRDQEKLFTPFFRADNRETKSVPGTGLGLAISHSLVEMHGGSIIVESERRRGSRFTVEIPACPPSDSGTARIPADRMEEPESGAGAAAG